jgi:hypothetical protein
MIMSNDPDEPVVTVTLTGLAIVPVANIAVSPITLALTDSVGGTASTGSFTITNTGTAPLAIQQMAFDPAPHPYGEFSFQVTPPRVPPFTLVASEVITVTVSFGAAHPTDTTLRTTVLKIQSNDPDSPNVVVNITGDVPDPALSFTSPLDFGSVDVCAVPAPRNITVTNNGGVTLNLFPPTFVGPPNGFSIIGFIPPATPAPGMSATLQLSFDPSSVGSHSATVDFTSSPSLAATTRLTLTGTAIRFTVPSSISFSTSTLPPEPNDTEPITLTNNGVSDIPITDIPITPNNYVDALFPFVFSVTNSSGNIPANGGSFSFTIVFNPAFTDILIFPPFTYNATLSFNHNGCIGPSIALSGAFP